MSIGEIPSNIGEGLGTMDAAALAAASGGGSVVYAPGELDFSFVVDPDCLQQFADGGQFYAVTVTAIRNADGVILDAATIAASFSVFLSFSPAPLQSSTFVWKSAPWLYGATASKTADGGDALPVGAYYAVIRIVNTDEVVLLEQVLGTIVVR